MICSSTVSLRVLIMHFSLNMSMAAGFQAYCTPVKMDPDENPDIKVY